MSPTRGRKERKRSRGKQETGDPAAENSRGGPRGAGEAVLGLAEPQPRKQSLFQGDKYSVTLST